MKKNAPTTIAVPEFKNIRLETYKLIFDLMKHITTLSSGSILILITLVEKVLKTRLPTWQVASAFGFFCISIIAAVLAMALLSFNASDGGLTDAERNVFAYASAIASVTFAVGIVNVALAAFLALSVNAGMNVYQMAR